MIKFEYDGEPYSIRFRHKRTRRDRKVSALTYCHIFRGSEPLTSGLAFCLIEDNFSKEIGRQISLERAIKNLRLGLFFSEQSESFFYAILDAYWGRSEPSASKRKSFSELREIRRKADVRKKIRMLERELKGLKKSLGIIKIEKRRTKDTKERVFKIETAKEGDWFISRHQFQIGDKTKELVGHGRTEEEAERIMVHLIYLQMGGKL